MSLPNLTVLIGKYALNLSKMVLMCLTASMALTVAACGATASSADPEVLATGEPLYMQHCASCHGAELEGQPDWQFPNANGVFPAPPHNRDGHTSHHPDTQLLQIIAEGGTTLNSAMPAFGDRLTQEEMEAILAYIKSFW
jgi:mono/diheme cytochrome c family protein